MPTFEGNVMEFDPDLKATTQSPFSVAVDTVDEFVTTAAQEPDPTVAASAGSAGASGLRPLASNAKIAEKVAAISPDLDLAFALLPDARDSNWRPVK